MEWNGMKWNEMKWNERIAGRWNFIVRSKTDQPNVKFIWFDWISTLTTNIRLQSKFHIENASSNWKSKRNSRWMHYKLQFCHATPADFQVLFWFWFPFTRWTELINMGLICLDVFYLLVGGLVHGCKFVGKKPMWIYFLLIIYIYIHINILCTSMSLHTLPKNKSFSHMDMNIKRYTYTKFILYVVFNLVLFF